MSTSSKLFSFSVLKKIDDDNLESLYQEVRKIKSIKSALLQLDRTNSV